MGSLSFYIHLATEVTEDTENVKTLKQEKTGPGLKQ